MGIRIRITEERGDVCNTVAWVLHGKQTVNDAGFTLKSLPFINSIISSATVDKASKEMH